MLTSRRSYSNPSAKAQSHVSEIVRAYRGGESGGAIARRLGLSRGRRDVYAALASSGVERRSWRDGCRRARGGRLATDLTEEIVRAYKAGESSSQIARRLGLKRPGSVTRVLKLASVARFPRGTFRRRLLDETRFDLATPEAAYWVGFLMADGCVLDRVSAGQHRLTISLSSKDAGHLAKLCVFLRTSGNRLYVYRAHGFAGHGTAAGRQCTLTVASDRLVAALMRFGVVPRKTACAEVRGGLELDRDFWRGCIDGDGSLGYYRRGPRFYPHLTLVGSRTLVGQFVAFSRTIYPETRASLVLRGRGHFGSVTFAGRPAYALTKALYANCVEALDRKRAVAESILRFGASVDPGTPGWQGSVVRAGQEWCRRAA